MHSEKRAISLNIITSILLQIVAVLNTFICSKIIISFFGSEANGLLSSIKQFLNYISLIEGGVGSVILASLYLPYYKHDDAKINQIYSGSRHFFEQIVLIFIAYSVALALIYPIVVKSSFGYKYIASMIIIVAISLIFQYYLFITQKLLLIAANKIYLCNIAQILSLIANLILIIYISKYRNLHLVQIGSCGAFLIQGILYYIYAKKYFKISYVKKYDKSILAQRWDGFYQNLAYFVNTNTDIVILTFFSLKEVSVYSVYMLVINGIRSVIVSVSNSFQALIGKSIAIDDREQLNAKFGIYERAIQGITIILYGTVLLLIREFVINYVGRVNDVNYNRICFPLIITLAYTIMCFREPYNLIINSANHFKQTVKGAVWEAVINIVISISLVFKFGIVGVAIGTLIASVYRTVYFIQYLQKNILLRDFKLQLKRFATYAIIILMDSILFVIFSEHQTMTWMGFIVDGLIAILINAIVFAIVELIANRKEFIWDILYLSKNRRMRH